MIKDTHYANHPASFANEIDNEHVVIVGMRLSMLPIVMRRLHKDMVIPASPLDHARPTELPTLA